MNTPANNSPLPDNYLDTLTLDQRQHYDNQERFLRAFEVHGRLYLAAEAAEISINTVESWQKLDRHGFQKRLMAAQQKCTERWEQVMDQRLQNPEGNRGSDPLLMFKLKKLDPAYRDNYVVIDPGLGIKLLARLNDVVRSALPSPEEPVVDAQVRELEAE